MLNRFRQKQAAHEVGQVVAEPVKLAPSRICGMAMTGQQGPNHHILAFLDWLFRRAALVVESDAPLGQAGYSSR